MPYHAVFSGTKSWGAPGQSLRSLGVLGYLWVHARDPEIAQADPTKWQGDPIVSAPGSLPERARLKPFGLLAL